MPDREALFPNGRHDLYATHRYSAAIRSGDLLFVSGQVGSRSDGTPEPGYAEQVRQAFANLAAVLDAAGATFDDIVDVTTFHTDPSTQFGPFLAVKDEFFPSAPYPAWTAVGATWLAGFDFEIRAVVRLPTAPRLASHAAQ